MNDSSNNGTETLDGKTSRKQMEKEKREREAQQKKQAKEAKKQEKILKKETKKKGRTLTKNQSANYAGGPAELTIPPIVEDTIIFLEQEDRLRQEGIFRFSGSLNDVKAIKESYTRGKPVDLTKIHDPHTVSGVLKIYFRESKNPLLTFEFYQLWIQTMAEGAEDAKSLAIKIRKVLRRLPPLNQMILKRLMGLLSKVAANADKNLMNVNNIAIVFAPTLLRPPGEAIDLTIQHSGYSNNLVKFIIENYNMVFSEERLEGEEGESGADGSKEESDNFEKELKRGSLLVARGSFIAPTRPADLERIVREEEEKAKVHSHNNATNSPNIATSPSSASPNAKADNSSTNDGTEDQDDETEEASDGESNDKEDLKKSSGTTTAPGAGVGAGAGLGAGLGLGLGVGLGAGGAAPAGGGTGKTLTMAQMMDMILEGEVTEVNTYLASLDQSTAATISQQLLSAIDEALKTTD